MFICSQLAYIQTGKKYGQGATYYLASNPEFGATFTYYLKDIPKTDKQIRQEKEKELFEAGKPIPQPTWKALADESKEIAPYLIFTIKDEDGVIVRKLNKKPSKGINRVTWDLNYAGDFPIRLKNKKFDPFNDGRGFWLVMPGKYTVSVSMYEKGQIKDLISDQEFVVKALNNTTLPAPDRKVMVDFQRKVAELTRVMAGTVEFNEELLEKVTYLKQAIVNTPGTEHAMIIEAEKIEKELEDILFVFEGNEAKASSEEIPPQQVPLYDRLQYIIWGQSGSTSAITNTSKEAYKIVQAELPLIIEKLEKIAKEDIKGLEEKLEKAKAPWTPGRIPVMD